MEQLQLRLRLKLTPARTALAASGFGYTISHLLAHGDVGRPEYWIWKQHGCVLIIVIRDALAQFDVDKTCD